MNRLLHYFYDKKAFYILYLSCIGIFCLILYLYNVFIEAVIYATILCLVLLIVYFAIDYFFYYQKTKNLESIFQLEDMILLDLPQSSGYIETQYQLLIHQIHHLLKEMKEQHEIHNQDMLDYFTLWVHQIKTPIFALRLLITSQNASTNDMLLQVLRIEQYVDMALHYMKLEQISSDLRIKRYDLNELIQDVIKKQATFFIQKKLTLKIDPIDLQVLTDAKWLSFVLEQILSNALKYTNSGSITIEMKDMVLSIKDTGIGIAPEDLPRVFDKSYTGYNGRSDKKASGIGLYLCKEIMTKLNHRIEIHSVVNEGTEVLLDLKRNEDLTKL